MGEKNLRGIWRLRGAGAWVCARGVEGPRPGRASRWARVIAGSQAVENALSLYHLQLEGPPRSRATGEGCGGQCGTTACQRARPC